VDTQQDQNSTQDLLRIDLLPHAEIVEQDSVQWYEIGVNQCLCDSDPFDPLIPKDMSHHSRTHHGIPHGPPGFLPYLVPGYVVG